MPDWTFHLLIGAGTGKALRLRNLHLVLLGALVPDGAAVLGTLSDFSWHLIDPVRLVYIAVPLGSLFGALCLCLAAAMWFDKSWLAFKLMLVGAATHFVADAFQVGHVNLLFYPFSFYLPDWPSRNYIHGEAWWLNSLAVAALIALRFLPHERTVRVSLRRAAWSLLPLVLLGAVAWSTAGRLWARNGFDLQYLSGEAVAEGTPVVVRSGCVVKSEPLTVRKLKRDMEIVGAGPLREGELVTIWGRAYGNRVEADRVVPHEIGGKIIFSILGALILLLYWAPIPAIDGRRPAREIRA